MDGRGDYKVHHVIADAGKHSVEVNIRIRRNGERRQSPVMLPISCSTPTPNATPTPPYRSMEYSREAHDACDAAYLDLFRPRKNLNLTPGYFNKLGTMPLSRPQYINHQPRTVNARTQTEPIPTPATTVNTKSAAQSKEYVETINQLHQLCAKLNAEVAEINRSKDKMESNLLGIIREKDVIISSYYKAQARTPVPRSVSVSTSTSPEGRSSSNDELKKFRAVILDVRSLISEEMEELKRRTATTAPATLYLEPFLHHFQLDDTDEVGGGGDMSRVTSRHKDKTNDDSSSGDTSSSASSVLTGQFSKDLMELDFSSIHLNRSNQN